MRHRIADRRCSNSATSSTSWRPCTGRRSGASRARPSSGCSGRTPVTSSRTSGARRPYRALRKATGLTAAGLLGCRREALREIAEQGGPHAELRVGKWRAIGELVEQHFDGDLQAALSLPLPKARAALKRFPGIGAPGADKVLLFTGAHAVPALESNGLRVLVRLGFAEDLGDYAKTYRTGVAALEAWTGQAPWLRRAYDLLRAHGQTLCKHRAPHCDTCPLEETCPSAE